VKLSRALRRPQKLPVQSDLGDHRVVERVDLLAGCRQVRRIPRSSAGRELPFGEAAVLHCLGRFDLVGEDSPDVVAVDLMGGRVRRHRRQYLLDTLGVFDAGSGMPLECRHRVSGQQPRGCAVHQTGQRARRGG
jgi:hypothetical protein